MERKKIQTRFSPAEKSGVEEAPAVPTAGGKLALGKVQHEKLIGVLEGSRRACPI